MSGNDFPPSEHPATTKAAVNRVAVSTPREYQVMCEFVDEEGEMTDPRVSMAYLPYSADGMGDSGV